MFLLHFGEFIVDLTDPLVREVTFVTQVIDAFHIERRRADPDRRVVVDDHASTVSDDAVLSIILDLKFKNTIMFTVVVYGRSCINDERHAFRYRPDDISSLDLRGHEL